jgi:hypothetical protein
MATPQVPSMIDRLNEKEKAPETIVHNGVELPEILDIEVTKEDIDNIVKGDIGSKAQSDGFESPPSETYIPETSFVGDLKRTNLARIQKLKDEKEFGMSDLNIDTYKNNIFLGNESDQAEKPEEPTNNEEPKNQEEKESLLEENEEDKQDAIDIANNKKPIEPEAEKKDKKIKSKYLTKQEKARIRSEAGRKKSKAALKKLLKKNRAASRTSDSKPSRAKDARRNITKNKEKRDKKTKGYFDSLDKDEKKGDKAENEKEDDKKTSNAFRKKLRRKKTEKKEKRKSDSDSTSSSEESSSSSEVTKSSKKKKKTTKKESKTESSKNSNLSLREKMNRRRRGAMKGKERGLRIRKGQRKEETITKQFMFEIIDILTRIADFNFIKYCCVIPFLIIIVLSVLACIMIVIEYMLGLNFLLSVFGMLRSSN